MANIAQTVNVLQAVILTDQENMVLTPTYHAFEMYIPFQDSVFVPTEFETPAAYELGEITVPAVSASAAKTSDGQLILALVNLDPNKTHEVTASLRGFAASGAQGRTLTAGTMDARNTFEEPDAVEPQDSELELENQTLVVGLPAKSVTVIRLEP